MAIPSIASFGEAQQLSEKIEESIDKTGNTLQGYLSKMQLPEASTAWTLAKNTLSRKVCCIVVAGEAKRAKSSFINGMIGKKVLPTGDNITTCQAFKVLAHTDESYKVRWMDGSATDVTVNELPRYGSQAFINEMQASGEQTECEVKRLDCLEVRTPCQFVPDNVLIIDTPGMGSIYASHKDVTERFVPAADGVIFVLSSVNVIVEEEIDFLEKILAITPHVFFIQSRIDQVTSEKWKEILRRNEEVLQAKFAQRLAQQVKVWPVSNVNLLKASESTDEEREEWLEDSHFPELYEALQAFFLKVGAGKRINLALDGLAQFYTENLRRLLARSQACDNALQDKTKALQDLKVRRSQLVNEYGENSPAFASLKTKVNDLTRNYRTYMNKILSPAAGWYMDLDKEIVDAGSIEELEQVNQKVAIVPVREVEEERSKSVRLMWNQASNYLGQYLDGIGQVGDISDIPVSKQDAHLVRGEAVTLNYNLASRCFDSLRSCLMSTSIGGLAAGIVATIISAPIAIVTGIATAIFARAQLKKHFEEHKLAAEKTKVRGALAYCQKKISNALTTPSEQLTQASVLDCDVNDLQKFVFEEAKKQYQAALSEYKREEERLKTDDDSTTEAKIAQEHLTAWGGSKTAIENLRAQNNALAAYLNKAELGQ